LPARDASSTHGSADARGFRRARNHSNLRTRMKKQDWALILGASSGFGEAVALELAAHDFNIFGVHLDRRETLPHATAIQQQIRDRGRQALFFNANAADAEKRKEIITHIAAELNANAGAIRVFLHSLAFGSLKPLVGDDPISQRQVEM